jgi:chromosome segregation ATPase
MARTQSTYTASPTRSRSPRRSPARRLPSGDGSEYEMDLDALGLNSTFESTELQASHEAAVDRVDTSEIEGPEDFTMNMTYWMTADLPLAQIKSRKEAKGKMQEVRMDAMHEGDASQDGTEMGNQLVEGHARALRDHSTTASPTRRANGTTDERAYSTPASERTMQHDEKVRSFLSNLPDTEMEGAIGGTPLHIPKHSFLQVPRSSPPKARSLQPTVEDYDTPRKPTQETVIHHATPIIDTNEHDVLRDQIDELQSRMARQELASKTRITELETIAAYTRSELESARTDAYKQKETAARLKEDMEHYKVEAEAARASAEARLKAREEGLDTKMHEYGEQMRVQNLVQLQKEREDFGRQLQALEESKRLVAEEAESRGQTLEQVQRELAELRRSNEQQLQQTSQEKSGYNGTGAGHDYDKLTEQLSSVHARANNLQTQLELATADAKIVRQDASKKEALRNAIEAEARARNARISELEASLQAAHFELECAQADISAKQQLFRTNLDLNSRLRTLQADLDIARTESTSKGQEYAQDIELETRITSLQTQLQSSRAMTMSKDQEILGYIRSQEQLEQDLNTARGRNEGLEAAIATLRQQLAEAHRESARVRTESERFERDLEDANERLHDMQAEADRRVHDLDQKLNKLKESKSEAERRFRELQSQHDDLAEGNEAMLEDVRDKAEDAVRKAGTLLDQERNEKRRIFKDLKRTQDELEKLRVETANKLAEEEDSSDEDVTPNSSTTNKEKDAEITKLREIIRKQVSEMKTLKVETITLRRECKTLKVAAESHSDVEIMISDLKDEIKTLRTQNATLQTNLEDMEAVNAAMDEKLAPLLSRVMKERAKTVVGKRDGQWQESVGQVQTEKELLGKVLLRQWGREEVGIANEKHGEKQPYKYQYVKRERP